MPTYEYQCKTCGTTFDVFQSIKSSPRRKLRCEKCDTVRPVRRLIGTGGGVIFKGSGFYQTDYRSDSYKKAASADGKTKTDSASDGSKSKSASGDGKASKPSSGKSSSGASGDSGSGPKSD